ncbi:hypothetical protein [Streptomyces sp. CdTB01]|uniref:hypothetical protein n=1 Tax=Streptomyces sp. CdTB01 TaxID=1725411 RepID=UPI00073AA3B1|nr:hypothetical protein [Streptomyces sp. CdTB01]ALV31122.1 hypothetical protein AS200_02850 [Streptomyces sp. CdTB01]
MTTQAAAPELSCYTAALLPYLESERPDVHAEFAAAIRLAVRTDLPEGGMAFSHHTRIDVDAHGTGLVHRSAPGWEAARAALTEEVSRRGRAIAVGNTRYLPWSPAYGGTETPHWLLVEALGDGRWAVQDPFQALTPYGAHDPWAGTLTDTELRAALTPAAALSTQAVHRDRYALGEETDPADPRNYRWLERAEVLRRPAGEGAWVEGAAALRHVAERVCHDPQALAAHADDLWTAARHQRHRLAARTTGAQPSQAVRRTADAWAELPRAARFATASAARGRPRPALVERAFTELFAALRALETTATSHPKDLSHER